jgi:hypothetical protein
MLASFSIQIRRKDRTSEGEQLSTLVCEVGGGQPGFVDKELALQIRGISKSGELIRGIGLALLFSILFGCFIPYSPKIRR